MKGKRFWNVMVIAALAALLFGGQYKPASADTTVVFDDATANARCQASYSSVNGPEPLSSCQWDMKTIKTALEKLKSLKGNKAYLVVKRGRDLKERRNETQGILSGGEEALAQKDAPTLFIYRQNEIPGRSEIAVWWPQLRFPDGNYVLAFSFNR